MLVLFASTAGELHLQLKFWISGGIKNPEKDVSALFQSRPMIMSLALF